MALRDGPAGWGTVAALAVIAATFSAVNPGLLLVVPFALMAFALPPRRPLMLMVAAVLAALVMTGPRGGVVWYFERGWALLVGAWFVLAVMALPRSGFLPRALAAVSAAAVTSLPFLWLNRGVFDRIDAALGSRLRDAAAQASAAWQRITEQSSPEATSAHPIADAIYRAADLQVMLFPALLALATLAGLAVAWWGFRRLAAGEREPLRPVREFRFPNDLVWLLIVGIVLVVLPFNAAATRTGSNLLTFMAALYALRGLAVLIVIGGAPGPFGLLLGLLAIVFLYPLVMATTVLVGLTDTWLDIRARRSASETRP